MNVKAAERQGRRKRTRGGFAGIGRVGTVASLGVAGVLVAAGGWWWNRSAGAAGGVTKALDAADWTPVRRLSFDLTIIETGQLEAARQVEIKSRIDGRPAILEVVDEGSSVGEGDVLVKLDDAELRRELEELELKLQTARADVVAAQQDLAIKQNEAAAAQRKAEVDLELAKLTMSEWEKGEVPTQRRKLTLALEKAQREVEQTARNYELDKELYAQKFISLDEFEQSDIDRIEAADALATAKLDIEVYDQFTFEKERQENQSEVDQALSTLETTIAENESTLEQLRAKLDSKTKSLAIQEERKRVLLEQIDATVLKAPQPGMVVYASSVGNRWRRGDPIVPGREVRSGETILLLPDTRSLVAVLRVPEVLAPQVRPGQTVSVTVDAKPGQAFAGTVESISVLAEDGGWLNPNLKEFTVRVSLALEPDHGLKPTMTCTGAIQTGRVDNALAVPVEAVFAEGRQHFVYVPGSFGRVVRRDVEIGQASETLVEVRSGLTLGESVLARAPRPGETIQQAAAAGKEAAQPEQG